MRSSDRRMTHVLGNRIKAYKRRHTECRSISGPLVAHVDRRSFRRFTRGIARPFHQDMIEPMGEVAQYLAADSSGLSPKQRELWPENDLFPKTPGGTAWCHRSQDRRPTGRLTLCRA